MGGKEPVVLYVSIFDLDKNRGYRTLDMIKKFRKKRGQGRRKTDKSAQYKITKESASQLGLDFEAEE